MKVKEKTWLDVELTEMQSHTGKLKGHETTFWGNRNIYILLLVVVTIIHTFVKAHQTVVRVGTFCCISIIHWDF